MSKRKFILEVPLFPGHYESLLTSSDTEYYAIQQEAEWRTEETGMHFTENDITFNYEKRKQDINENFIAEIEYMLKDKGFVESMTFESMTSPRYYNFETDRLWAHVKMTADWVSKMRNFMKENYSWLKTRIKEDWSSRDGFWSWTSNDIEEWYDLLLKEYDEKYIAIMLGYILTGDIDDCEDLVREICCNALEDIYDGEYAEMTEEAEEKYNKYLEKQESLEWDRKHQLTIPFPEEA